MGVAQGTIGKASRPSRARKVWNNVAIVFESRIATVGLAMVAFWFLVGLISLVWTPYPPNAQLFTQNLPPNAANWLGTDHLGRDLLSRLMVGTQVILLKTRVPEAPLSGYLSLLGSIFGLAALGMFVNVVIQMYSNWSKAWAIVSIFVPVLAFVWGWSRVSKLPLGRTMIVWTATMVLAGGLFYLSAVAGASVVPGVSIPLGVALWGVLGSLVTGAVLGLNASYRGGWWDQAIMQLSDALIAFPRIVLFLVVIAALGQGDLVVIVAITVTGAPGVARLVRSLGFDIKTRDYVRAAETRGENAGWIMYREILPNARGPILIDSMLRVGYAIFAIGTLGFLGIGLPPPDPDWGNMVNEARRNIFNNPWGVVWPAVAIATLVIGLNLLADGLREELTRFQK